MNDFNELLTADIRLVILRALQKDSGYAHNESTLQGILQYLGHKIARDRLRTELAWLAEQGLIALSEVAGIQVAKLKMRGSDVALGLATVPGVKRPGPED